MMKVADLGRSATHTSQAEAMRSATQRHHAAALKAWDGSSLPNWLTEEAYIKHIQPKLRELAVSAIALALGVSIPYATDIRAGRRRPHPRHWLALGKLVGVLQKAG